MVISLPVLKSAAEWLLGQVGSSLFSSAKQQLMKHMGLSSPSLTSSEAKSLLNIYFEGLTKRLDEDRVAKLWGAFSQLKDAPRFISKAGTFQPGTPQLPRSYPFSRIWKDPGVQMQNCVV